MNFLGLGKPKQRSPAELARATKDLLLKYCAQDPERPVPKIEEELARSLSQIKHTFQGTAEEEVRPEQVCQLLIALYNEDFLLPLAQNLHKLPFESRKDSQIILSTTFRFKDPARNQSEPFILADLLVRRQEVFVTLCQCYERMESAMPAGTALRQALQRDAVAALILYKEPNEYLNFDNIDINRPASGQGIFWSFFNWIHKGPFEISADAFSTFRDLLTRHSHIVAPFLQTNFDRFFLLYNTVLVQSDNYVTKRQSTKLLGEILLNRANYSIMTKYVESGEHLKIIMKLLRDERKMINYEAFHVFKVFVANPNKSLAVQKILIGNKEKLLRFLPGFLADRTDDDQFVDEKSFLIRSIELLPTHPVDPSAAQQQGQGQQGAGGEGGVAT